MANEPTTTTVDEMDPAIAAIEENTELVVQQATAITIVDAGTYDAAGSFLTETLKPALREIEATFGPIVTAAHLAHKEALGQRKRHEAPLKEAEKIIKGSMGVYVTEQRRIAAAAEAERIRVAREEADARKLEEAAALEAAGHTEAAEEKLAAPAVPVMVAPPPEVPKSQGTSARMVTKFRIIDASAIGRAYLVPDDKKIGQLVRAMGADAERLVGGIEVYEEPVIAASAR